MTRKAHQAASRTTPAAAHQYDLRNAGQIRLPGPVREIGRGDGHQRGTGEEERLRHEDRLAEQRGHERRAPAEAAAAQHLTEQHEITGAKMNRTSGENRIPGSSTRTMPIRNQRLVRANQTANR